MDITDQPIIDAELQIECTQCQELISSHIIDEHESACISHREEMDTVKQPTTNFRTKVSIKVSGVNHIDGSPLREKLASPSFEPRTPEKNKIVFESHSTVGSAH